MFAFPCSVSIVWVLPRLPHALFVCLSVVCCLLSVCLHESCAHTPRSICPAGKAACSRIWSLPVQLNPSRHTLSQCGKCDLESVFVCVSCTGGGLRGVRMVIVWSDSLRLHT